MMGLISFARFSSIPNLFRKIRQRTIQKETFDTQKPSSKKEWISDNGLRIIVNATVLRLGAPTVIYTVPEGKIFYLFSTTMAGDNNAAGNDLILIRIAGTIFTQIYVTANQAENLAIQLTEPIKMIAGEEITIAPGGDASITAGILGYEIDASVDKQKF